MDEKKEITTEDREELEYPLVIPEEKESRDLWSNIKELRKKFRKPEVVPEEFRLPEFTTPLERKEADAHQGLSKAEVERPGSTRCGEPCGGVCFKIPKRDHLQ